MSKENTQNYKLIVKLFCFIPWFVLTTGYAANECRIKYQYHTNSGGKITKHLYINSGQTKSINRGKMDYVKNLKTNRVKFYLTGPGVTNKTLNKNQTNPTVGFYLTPTKLVKAKCLSGGSGSTTSNQTPQALVNTLKIAGKTANHIAEALKVTFNSSRKRVAQLLKQAGFSVKQIASAIKSTFNASMSQVAQALKAAGYTVKQVASALKSTFNASMAQVAQALKAAGYTVKQVASALKSAFNATMTQVAQALKAAGYYSHQINSVMVTLKSGGGETIANKQIVNVLNSPVMKPMVLYFAEYGENRSCLYKSLQDNPPINIPNNNTRHTYTLFGKNLNFVTSIYGLPRGSSHTLEKISPSCLKLRIRVVPTHSSKISKGTAKLMRGQHSGPSLRWIVKDF